MSQPVAPCTAPVYVLHAVALQPKHYEESHLREAAPMVRVPAFSAILLISGLTGATLMTAQANDQLAPPQTAVERARPARPLLVPIPGPILYTPVEPPPPTRPTRKNHTPHPPQTAVERARPAERTIVCNRRHCWAIREGCRLVVAPHFRDNRIRCGPARPA